MMEMPEWLKQLKTEAGQGVKAPASSAAPELPAEARRDLPSTGSYKRLYRIVWNLHEKYSPPPRSDAGPEILGPYWQRVMDEMTDAANANDNDPFLLDMLVAVHEELERESNKRP